MDGNITSHFNEMLILKLLSNENLSLTEMQKMFDKKTNKTIELSVQTLSVYLYRLRNDNLIKERLIGSEDVLYEITESGKITLANYIDRYGRYTKAANKILNEK